MLQILESVIKFRWGALPEEQRQGIKNYISNLIIKLSSDDQTFRRQKVFLNKLNVILVQVLKQDWPHKWPTFVTDIVGASKTSETLCENSMHILKLLSEEVFDFSRGEMTQAKIKDLKNSLNSEFKLIHELCLFVLNASQKPDLIRATLGTLYAFLSWVPLGYVFESNLVEILLKLFPQPAFRNLALQCLTEVSMQQYQPALFACASCDCSQSSSITLPRMLHTFESTLVVDAVGTLNIVLGYTPIQRNMHAHSPAPTHNACIDTGSTLPWCLLHAVMWRSDTQARCVKFMFNSSSLVV